VKAHASSGGAEAPELELGLCFYERMWSKADLNSGMPYNFWVRAKKLFHFLGLSFPYNEDYNNFFFLGLS
jgi:hypothetical protein